MPFDFGSLPERAAFETLTSPQEIFNALPDRAAHLEYLRASQGAVLDEWEKRRQERDLVIKVNTGGGKTIVGLLVLQASLNEGVGPALYVAPDPYLVGQVQEQAHELGLSTIDDPEDPRYVEGGAICVVNVHRLINGLSVFGAPGSVRASPFAIGSLVIDDVHAALATAAEQFTVSVPRSSQLYNALFELFESDLRQQAPGAVAALKADDNSVMPQIVPFWSLCENSDATTGLLQEASASDSDLRFKWPLIRDHVTLCRAVFGAGGFELAPQCLPIDSITAYREARRRVFLTATLADDSVLVTMFNANPDSVKRSITPGSASDQGDRLILAPQEINRNLSQDDVKAAVAALAERANVVVIVPSNRRAGYWGDVADLVARADTIPGAVKRLRADHVGLVVLVNKYDGIDLPEKACQVLVIDGLPEAYSLLDRRDAAVLGTADALFDRQMQRIEQGMGRGVRGSNDHCVVLLLGARLTERVATPSLRSQFSALTLAQLDLSRTIANELKNKSMAELVEVIDQVLGRDRNWVAASRGAIARVSYSPGIVTPSAAAMRMAFNSASIQQYEPATTYINEAATAEDNVGMKGLLKETLAQYTYFIDQTRAQNVLATAITENPRILRPIRGFTPGRISPHADQAAGVVEALSSVTTADELILKVRAVLEDLEFDPDRTAEFEAAVDDLGSILGFVSARPERDEGNGPDDLWAVGASEFLVIECKSGVTGTEIHRSAASQLAHSMAWFADRYRPPNSGRAVMVHPSTQLAPNAVLPQKTRIIDKEGLELLRQHVREFAEALASSGYWRDAAEIAPRLETHRLNAGQILLAHSSVPRSA